MRDLAGLAIENLNVRYLAWRASKESSDPADWIVALKRKASIEGPRAREILNGAPPRLTAAERERISEGFGEEADDLGTVRLFGFSPDEVLKANIRALIRQLPPGGQKKMATEFKVSEEAVSRWVTGHTPPSQKNRIRILRYIGLDTGIDLKQVPLFLSLIPIGQYAQRGWLRDKVEELTPNDLTELFPALRKLLDRREDP